MTTLDFPNEFIDMVQLLLSNSSIRVKVNGVLSNSFPITREVRQGCPLAPYLFLIVAEVMIIIIAREVAFSKNKTIQRIQLPIWGRQQVLAQ